MKLSLTLLSSLVAAVSAADKAAWKSRTIYFAMTDRIARSSSDGGGSSCGNLGDYCGGTFQGLQGKLDYINGMGFDAIWITPVVANSDGGYHGYWAQDLYNLNGHYGTPQDLKNLVAAAHAKQMFVMVDVVANHMGNGAIADNRPSPLDKDASYHPACDIDYNNQTSVEQCRIANLPDVNTEDSTIRSTYQAWIKWLISEYSFDGIRIDTVKHVHEDFWPGFTTAAAVYSIGEVFSGDPDYVVNWAPAMSGLLNYPVYYPLNAFFQQKGSSQALVDMHNNVGSKFPDASAMGTFVDNHDNPRFLNERNDVSLFKNALTYVLLARGVPIVYYGTEQAFSGGADPANREDLWRSNFNTQSDMYQWMSKVIGAKKSQGGLPNDDHNHLFVNDTAYAWARADGNIIALTSNIGSGNSLQYCFSTQKPNKSWTGLFDGKSYSSDGNGQMCATVTNGEPIVFKIQ